MIQIDFQCGYIANVSKHSLSYIALMQDHQLITIEAVYREGVTSNDVWQ